MDSSDVLPVVRWGILGAGDVCEKKSGPPLYLLQGSSVIAVMRRNVEQAGLISYLLVFVCVCVVCACVYVCGTYMCVESFAKRHNIPKVHTEARDLIHDVNVDAGTFSFSGAFY